MNRKRKKSQMSLHNQNLSMALFTDLGNAFDTKDEYSTAKTEYASMDVIKSLLQDFSFPAFIADEQTGEIFFANREASTLVSADHFIGTPLGDHIFVQKDSANKDLCYFYRKWYFYNETAFEDENGSYLIVKLHRRKDIPDDTTLESWKNMIEVMLHRFRSPMTGISGYVDMLEEDITGKKKKKWLENIHSGIDHLYTMMDELEHLYHLPTNFNASDTHLQDVIPVIQNSIMDSSQDTRARLVFEQPDDPIKLNFDRESLKRILDQLIQNAALHSVDPDQEITLSVSPEGTVNINNFGRVISNEMKDQIFAPFVTTKSDNLGIGLTMALLYAQQFGGSLSLSENDAENGITFSILFPAN